MIKALIAKSQNTKDTPSETLNNFKSNIENKSNINMSGPNLTFLLNDNSDFPQNYIIDCMNKIFKLPEPNIEEETSVGDDNLYIIRDESNKISSQNKFPDLKEIQKEMEEKSGKPTAIKNDSLEIMPNQKENTKELSFISKKRKNSQKKKEKKEKKYIPKNEKQIKISINANKEKDDKTETLEKTQPPKYQYRLDYYKKAFKVNCFKHLTKFLNYLISKCNFPMKFKNKKIFKPNNESFTANAKEEDNYLFLFMSIKDIFCYIKDDKKTKGISLQKSNKIYIDMLLKYMEGKDKNYSKNFENLKKYLNMTMEDYMKIYYDTEEFQKFCDDEKIKFYEEEFIKEKKFPILQKYGFLKLIKMNQNYKNFSYGLKSIHPKMNGINSV